MSGKRSRSKGLRNEREIVNFFKERGIHAERVPLSGAIEGFPGDIKIQGEMCTFIAEAKCRANGFKQIYDWKADNDMLFIKADRQEQLVVMNLDLLIKIMHQNFERAFIKQP